MSRQGTQYWLRPLTLDDIPDIARWYESVEDLAMFHRHMPVPVSAAAIESGWRDDILASEPRRSYWFIADDDQHAPVGFGGIEDIDYTHGSALAPFFIAPPARRRGLAVRLRALLLDLAFDQLALTRITSIHRADNLGSRRVNEQCGFQLEGRLRRAWWAGGEHVDLLVLGLLAEEWRDRRGDLRQELRPDTVLTLGRDPSGRWSWPAVPEPE